MHISMSSAYVNRIEECERHMSVLEGEISLHKEQISKLNKQFSMNRDNIDR